MSHSAFVSLTIILLNLSPDEYLYQVVSMLSRNCNILLNVRPMRMRIPAVCHRIGFITRLGAKGAQFRGSIEQREYGRVTMIIVPGADDIQLYQLTHNLAYNL